MECCAQTDRALRFAVFLIFIRLLETLYRAFPIQRPIAFSVMEIMTNLSRLFLCRELGSEERIVAGTGTIMGNEY